MWDSLQISCGSLWLSYLCISYFLMLLLGHCFGVNLLGCLEEGQCRHIQSELYSNGSVYSHSILRASSLRWVSLVLCSVAKCCWVWATLSFLILTSFLNIFPELSNALLWHLPLTSLCLLLMLLCFLLSAFQVTGVLSPTTHPNLCDSFLLSFPCLWKEHYSSEAQAEDTEFVTFSGVGGNNYLNHF